LKVGEVAETVEVQSDRNAIQTEDSSLGQVIKGQVGVDLPLAARRYTDLAFLVPGPTEGTYPEANRGSGWLVVNGHSQTLNNYLLDGFDNNNNTNNQQSRSPQVISPSPDTLSEFKIQTNNFSAEFGRAAGAVINASIKSGTNNVHGAAWFYNRPAALSANKWENNWQKRAKDELNWNQVGGAVGGPIRKDKLFYFGDYEGFFSEVTTSPFVTVPTMAQRNGDFSALTIPVLDPLTGRQFPGNIIPSTRFDPLAKKLLDQVYPEPNFVWPTAGSGGRPINNYTRKAPTTEDTHKFDVRTDYYTTERNRIFARYSYNRTYRWIEPTLPGLGDTGTLAGGSQFARNQAVGVSWNHTFSPTIINEARLGFNSTQADFTSATAASPVTGTSPQAWRKSGGCRESRLPAIRPLELDTTFRSTITRTPARSQTRFRSLKIPTL